LLLGIDWVAALISFGSRGSSNALAGHVGVVTGDMSLLTTRIVGCLGVFRTEAVLLAVLLYRSPPVSVSASQADPSSAFGRSGVRVSSGRAPAYACCHPGVARPTAGPRKALREKQRGALVLRPSRRFARRISTDQMTRQPLFALAIIANPPVIYLIVYA